MRLAVLVLAAVATLAACSEPAGPPSTPPEGWTAEGDRWWVPGIDTSAAFRELATLDTMGVVQADDPELIRWFQERLTEFYRTNPEIVDSVFRAQFVPVIEEQVPPGDDYATAAEGVLRQIKNDFYQRYNATRVQPPTDPLALPTDLQGTGGQVTVQVYVNPDKQPVAVELVEGTGTALDQIAMRRAIESTFTDAWVRPTAGRSGGVNIPNWVWITSTFGE